MQRRYKLWNDFPRFKHYTIFKRFMKCIKIKDEKECWEWSGRVNAKYGRFIWPEKHITYAHVASYELFKGRRHGLKVCHSCDNNICVNPYHLWLGTQKDNIADMLNKGRDAMRGERNNKAKLNRHSVKKIRKLYKTGNKTYKELGIKFGVTDVMIGNIVNKRNWIN